MRAPAGLRRRRRFFADRRPRRLRSAGSSPAASLSAEDLEGRTIDDLRALPVAPDETRSVCPLWREKSSAPGRKARRSTPRNLHFGGLSEAPSNPANTMATTAGRKWPRFMTRRLSGGMLDGRRRTPWIALQPSAIDQIQTIRDVVASRQSSIADGLPGRLTISCRRCQRKTFVFFNLSTTERAAR